MPVKNDDGNNLVVCISFTSKSWRNNQNFHEIGQIVYAPAKNHKDFFVHNDRNIIMIGSCGWYGIKIPLNVF